MYSKINSFKNIDLTSIAFVQHQDDSINHYFVNETVNFVLDNR
jgi:hypothetical protein